MSKAINKGTFSPRFGTESVTKSVTFSVTFTKSGAKVQKIFEISKKKSI